MLKLSRKKVVLLLTCMLFMFVLMGVHTQTINIAYITGGFMSKFTYIPGNLMSNIAYITGGFMTDTVKVIPFVF